MRFFCGEYIYLKESTHLSAQKWCIKRPSMKRPKRLARRCIISLPAVIYNSFRENKPMASPNMTSLFAECSADKMLSDGVISRTYLSAHHQTHA